METQPTTEKEYICSECGEPCEVVSVDFGIGTYEYFGFRGVDIQIESVSKCCEADYIKVADLPKYPTRTQP